MTTYSYITEARIPPSEDWIYREKLTRSQMIDNRLNEFMKGYWWFRLRSRGNQFGPWIIKPLAHRRFIYRVDNHGDDWLQYIQRRNKITSPLRPYGRILRVHKVENEPPAPDLGCHSMIEKAYGALYRRFGTRGINNGGIYYCRYVDGRPGLVSRHGYKGATWKGAAGDIFSNPDTMDALYERARFLVAECRAGRLHLDRIICGDDVWESYDGWTQPHYYSGIYHRHVHFEVHDGWGCM